MNHRNHVQRALSCGFMAGNAKIRRVNTCCATEVISESKHVYPIACPTPRSITIDRVVQLAGVDNALFLVGDVERGYRMNRNYTVELPGEAVNITSSNYPTYLLLKDGDSHTLGFSTANIEGFIRQNRHMFTRDGITHADLSFFADLAPQDMSVEGMSNANDCKPEREFRFRIVSNTTLNDCTVTIEVTVFECDVLIDREIWFIVPCRCENANTFFGANMLPFNFTPRTCGEIMHVPGRATDNGQFVFANYPNCGCGHNGNVHVHRPGGCACRR